MANVTLLGLLFSLCMCLLILVLPRRHAVLPILILACYVTLGQYIMVGPLHFYMVRILILVGLLRVLFRKESALPELTKIDKAIIYWVMLATLIYVARVRDIDALINRSGFALNALGLYFLFRFLIRDYSDIIRICKMLSIIVVPLAVLMYVEKITGRNFFSLIGGVPEFSAVRDGKLRAQGSFLHPILAGTFGATTFYLLSGVLFRSKVARKTGLLGAIAALIITIAASSSGPVLALLFGMIGAAMWHIRHRLRVVRWGIVLSLIILHMAMKAPVWYLFDRISQITGGTGWHRAELINSFVHNFNEWWLMGTDYTAHWMPYVMPNNPNMTDITNNFIRTAIDGGLLSLILFIIIIVVCYKALGISIKSIGQEQFVIQMILWSLGVALFTHLVSFLSVSYFDQISVFWYMLLAMISCLTYIVLPEQQPSKANVRGPVR